MVSGSTDKASTSVEDWWNSVYIRIIILLLLFCLARKTTKINVLYLYITRRFLRLGSSLVNANMVKSVLWRGKRSKSAFGENINETFFKVGAAR